MTDLFFAERTNLGSTISFSKEMVNSMDFAIKMGMYSFQIFLGGRMSCRRSKLSEKDIKDTVQMQEKFKMNINSHLPYTYNLCGNFSKRSLAWNGDKYQDKNTTESLKAIEYELDVLSNFNNKNGKAGCVLHLGSWDGGGRSGKGKVKRVESKETKKLIEVKDLKDGIDPDDVGLLAACKSINKIDFPDNSMLLLENMTSGNKLCKDIREMQNIWSVVEQKKNVGWCIDTAHIHGEGQYDLGTIDGIDRLLVDFDSTIGLENLKLIHLNDSMVKLGDKRDKHETIGNGFIWGGVFDKSMGAHSKDNRMSALSYFMDKTRKIPTVLETSISDYPIIQMY